MEGAELGPAQEVVHSRGRLKRCEVTQPEESRQSRAEQQLLAQSRFCGSGHDLS